MKTCCRAMLGICHVSIARQINTEVEYKYDEILATQHNTTTNIALQSRAENNRTTKR